MEFRSLVVGSVQEMYQMITLGGDAELELAALPESVELGSLKNPGNCVSYRARSGLVSSF